MRFHDTLNSLIWDLNTEDLIPEVKEKLEEIADAFIEFLEIPTDAVLDKVITGSSASYNYNEFSDLDLHIIVDYDKVHEDCPLVNGYLNSLKKQFNDNHDITIHGVPVELYAEQKDQGTVHNGLYSLQTGWIDKPQKIAPTDNDAAVEAKYNEIKELVDKCDDSEEATELLEKIYNMRKAGLAEAGEFCTENLAFKKLRNEGCMDKLRKIKKEQIDKQLSLESYNEEVNPLYVKNLKTLEKYCNDHLIPKLKAWNKEFNKNTGGLYLPNFKNIVIDLEGDLIYIRNFQWIDVSSGALMNKYQSNDIRQRTQVEAIIEDFMDELDAIFHLDFDDDNFYELDSNEICMCIASSKLYKIDLDSLLYNKNESIKEEVLPHNIPKLNKLIDRLNNSGYWKVDGDKIRVDHGFGTVAEQMDLSDLADEFRKIGFKVYVNYFSIEVKGLKDFIEKQDNKNESVREDIMNIDAELLKDLTDAFTETYQTVNGNKYKVTAKQDRDMIEITMARISKVFPIKRTFLVKLNDNKVELFFNDKKLYSINKTMNAKAIAGNFKRRMKEFDWGPDYELEISSKDKLIMPKLNIKPLNQDVAGNYIILYHTDKGYGINIASNGKVQWWNLNNKEYPSLEQASNIAKEYYPDRQQYYVGKVQSHFYAESLNESINEEIGYYVIDKNGGMEGEFSTKSEANGWKRQYNKHNKLDIKNDYVIVTNTQLKELKDRGITKPEDIFREVKKQNESIKGKKEMREDDRFNYMMLGRLKQDCDYFLGHGDGYEKHLWAGNVEDQIAKMKELYNKVPEKPEWLSLEDIDKYKKDMLALKEQPIEEDLATLEKKMDNAEKDLQDMISKLKGTTNEELITNLDTVIKKALAEEVEIDSHKFTFKVTDTNIQLKSDWYETIIDIDGELDQTQLKSDIEDTLDFESTDFFEGEGEITGTEIVGFKYNEDTKEGEFEFNIFFE